MPQQELLADSDSDVPVQVQSVHRAPVSETMKATAPLANGSMPMVGLGTWKAEKGVVGAAVERAIHLGYRHIDCAAVYENEKEVGNALKKCLDSGAVQRSDLWITSKLWNTMHRRDHVRQACLRTIEDLQVEYLDLYLIHFPIAMQFVDPEEHKPAGPVLDGDGRAILEKVSIRETWEAMEELVKEGLVKNIGVSNFNAALLIDLLSFAKIKPSVNQIERHPYLTQPELVAFCKYHGIHVTAYSSFGHGSYIELGVKFEGTGLLEHPVIQEIAGAHSCSTAQVLLAWGLQSGTSVIPKSVHDNRLQENFDADKVQLAPEEMRKIDALNNGTRFNDVGKLTKNPPPVVTYALCRCGRRPSSSHRAQYLTNVLSPCEE